MQYISHKDHQFSQLILGTVQLGIDYGIANRTGQPSHAQSVEMIKFAVNQGINTLDTAREYGSAESVIAQASPIEAGGGCHVMTKFRINPQIESDLEKSWKEVLTIVRKSLNILNRKNITSALFHRSPHNNLEVCMKVLPEIISRLKEMHLINYGGLSAHYPDDVRYALDENQLEIIQVPCNLFDHRLLNLTSQDELKNKLVVARSVFLQGLFFLDPDGLTGNLIPAREPLLRLREMVADLKITISQLAVAFVRDLPQVDCLVIGALNQTQIAENIALVEKSTISESQQKEVLEMFSEMDHLIITPALWKV